MWFHIGCCDVKVDLCRLAACVLFHRSACLVKNTTVSKLLRLRFMQFDQVLGFQNIINNIHFLMLYEGSLLGNWLEAQNIYNIIAFTRQVFLSESALMFQ